MAHKDQTALQNRVLPFMLDRALAEGDTASVAWAAEAAAYVAAYVAADAAGAGWAQAAQVLAEACETNLEGGG